MSIILHKICLTLNLAQYFINCIMDWPSLVFRISSFTAREKAFVLSCARVERRQALNSQQRRNPNRNKEHTDNEFRQQGLSPVENTVKDKGRGSGMREKIERIRNRDENRGAERDSKRAGNNEPALSCRTDSFENSFSDVTAR